MSALRTSQRRIRRQRELCIAFTANVSHGLDLGLSTGIATCTPSTASAIAEGGLIVEGGDLVGFAGHFGRVFLSLKWSGR
jgi:hypothetical protein